MKQFFIIVLVICTAAMCYISCHSVTDEMDTQELVVVRQNAVKARLKQLAVIEEEYKKQHVTKVLCPEFDNEAMEVNFYCEDLDSLIRFVNTAQMAVVLAEGELTAQNLDDGLTESTAVEIVRSGNAELIAKHNLYGFRRDTTFVSMVDSLRRYQEGDKLIFGEDFDFNTVKFIPYSGDTSDDEQAQVGSIPFEVQTHITYTRSGTPLATMQAQAPFTSFLQGMGPAGKRQMQELISKAEKRGDYEGLRIGGLNRDEWNNNAGNWD